MTPAGAPAIIGESPALRRAVDLAEKFAPSSLPILLVGATGTGKDLLARAIHRWSGRKGPFVDVNCGGLPRELVDGLLFGHRRGTFSGATENVCGLMEAADGGTLFLDELCSLPLEAQVKLLRVLESGALRRLGETTSRPVSVRVIAAAQDGLDERLRSGAFRRDLYQRLAGLVLELPALSARKDDVVALARHFAAGHGRALGPEAIVVLRSYSWPGNVRELRTAVERAVFLTGHAELGGVALAEAIELGLPTAGEEDRAERGKGTEDDAERERMLVALARSGWHAARAAGVLGIARSTLFKRCRALGISIRVHRSPRTVHSDLGLSDCSPDAAREATA